MQNVEAEQFDFETFKAAYDTDPRIKEMVKNFDKFGIQPKTKADSPEDTIGTAADATKKDNTVGNMAKSATNVGAKL